MVLWLFRVQTNEVSSVQCENCASFGNGESQHFLIRQRLVMSPRFRGSHHIVTKLAKSLDDRQRKVLVGVEACHQAASLS
jgi:hypothetical protein